MDRSDNLDDNVDDNHDDHDVSDGDWVAGDEHPDETTDPPHDSVDAPPHRAATAPNWRSIIAVDVLLGVAVMVLGAFAAFRWQPVLGSGLSSLGLLYVMLALRRASLWRSWRQRNGLG